MDDPTLHSGPATNWLSSFPSPSFPGQGGHHETGPHQAASPATATAFSSTSPAPFDDGSRGPHSILGFGPDMAGAGMNFGDPSLAGLGGGKMGGGFGPGSGLGGHSGRAVTSSADTDQLFSSRLQNSHKLDYTGPSYSPSLMGYSGIGSMGQQGQPGHISPTFGQSAAAVVTKQETFAEQCGGSEGGQAAASSSGQSTASLAEFNQATSKGHEILSQVYNQSSLPIRLMPVRARKYPNRPSKVRQQTCIMIKLYFSSCKNC